MVSQTCQLSRRPGLVLLLLLSALAPVFTRLDAADVAGWQEALAQMPLRPAVTQLNRTNCVEIMLDSFRSNEVVKGLIFMPGATDEFYMFRRAQAELAMAAPSLLDAVRALTNQSYIRVTFRAPFLLLHTGEDVLEPEVVIENAVTVEKLKRLEAPALKCNDRDWDYLQPRLRKALHIDLRPWRNSQGSWHFYRHSFAAFGLSGYEALEAAALAGKSRFTIRRNRVVFEVDSRVGVAPEFKTLPKQP